eukprot:jgi/Tetstr1/447086/TSEL_034524.t1
MARVQSSTPGGGVDWQFRCCDGSCGRTYQRPAPMCTHVNYGMEFEDPEVAAMHLAYAATFDPSVYVRPAVVRKLAERRVRLWEAGDAVRAGFLVCGVQQLWRESRDGSELHNSQMETGELPAGTSRSARRRKRWRYAIERAAYGEAAEGGADAAADGVPPAVLVDAHRRAAKLTAVRELRRARQALDTADLGMVSDAAAALPVLEAAIVQMSMPADFGGLHMALLQSEAPAAFYSAKSVVLPKPVREYGPALGHLYEAVRAEMSTVATSALPWARETRRVYKTVRALTTLPQAYVQRARAAYGHAHEIFELPYGCRGLAT